MEFMPTPNRENLRELLAWWVFLFGVLLWSQWRSKRAAGLPLVYGFAITMMHAIGAAVYCVDGYQPRSPILLQSNYNLACTFTGFYVALIGLASFVFGCLICPVIFPRNRPRLMGYAAPQITTQLPGTLLLISLLFFFLIRPLINRVPSFASIGSAGTYLSVLAITMYIYVAYQSGDRARFAKWLISTTAFPVITVLTMGFAGYGGNAAAAIWAFCLRFYRPRWLGVLAFTLLLYAGMTLYINYMRERISIRESVWGQRDLSSRIQRATNIFSQFELFDIHSQVHLETVDLRMNQNDLVGKAVIYIEGGRVATAEGGTLYAAALALIPRILWPNKPASGGSGSLVSRFTGVNFAAGTSVGVGQVLEFYVNWKLPSVIIGFLVFGLVMTYIDQTAGTYWAQGDLWNAIRWLLPGMGMVQAGGSMAEIVSSVAGNAVFVWGLHRYLFARYYEDLRKPPPPHTLRGSRNLNLERGSRVERPERLGSR